MRTPESEELGVCCGKRCSIEIVGLEEFGCDLGLGAAAEAGIEGDDVLQERHVGLVDNFGAGAIGCVLGADEIPVCADVLDVVDEIVHVEACECARLGEPCRTGGVRGGAHVVEVQVADGDRVLVLDGLIANCVEQTTVQLSKIHAPIGVGGVRQVGQTRDDPQASNGEKSKNWAHE